MNIKTVVLVFVLILTACSSDNGEDYIGHWVSITNSYQTLDIARNGNGNNFLIIRKPGSRELPALYNNGQLEAHGGMQVYVIEKATGQLTSGHRIYTRQ